MDSLEHVKQYVAELIQDLDAEKSKSKSYLSIFCINKQKAHHKCPLIKKTWSKNFKAERNLLDMLIYRKMSLKIKNVDSLVSDLPRNAGKIYLQYLNCLSRIQDPMHWKTLSFSIKLLIKITKHWLILLTSKNN